MMWTVVSKGLGLLSWDFFTHDMSTTGPLTPGGGAKHAIIGTLEQVGIATIVVVPLGILTAVYLHEIRGRIAPPIRFIVDAMSGLPSIVAGLLIYTVWVDGHGFSGVAGSAALVVLMLPTMTRASEEILRTIPDTSARRRVRARRTAVAPRAEASCIPTALAGLVTASIARRRPRDRRDRADAAHRVRIRLDEHATRSRAAVGPSAVRVEAHPPAERQPRSTARGPGALILVLLVLVLFVTARFVANRARGSSEETR